LENIPKGIHRTPEARAEWARLFCESGLSLRKFSAQHGLHWHALWRWVDTREKALKAEKAALEAQIVEFTEIKMHASMPTPDWAAEISFPDGRVLRFSKEVPASTIEQLLRVW
jgi:hypothetical protein